MSTTPPNLFSIEDAPGSGFEIVDQPSAAPAAAQPERPGFLKSLGSDLWGMAKGLPQAALSAAPGLSVLQEALPKSVQSVVGYTSPQEQVQAMMAADQARKAAGRSAAYRAIAPIGELAGVNVGGMEQSADQGDVGGVLGHAAAVPTAMAATAGLGKLGGAVVKGTLESGAASKMVPRLLNASGDVSPETLQNLRVAEPILQKAGAPDLKTPAGVAQHFTNLSNDIQNRIAPIIKEAATRDVSASTAQIASNLRAEITPEMQATNPGTANAIEKTAKSLDNVKTLGSLDELRQQLNDKVLATKSRTVVKQYLGRALNQVYDTIADHAQAIRPDLDVRGMRTQQSALMKLADTFKENATNLEAQRVAERGLSTSQKARQAIPDLIKMGMNPRQAIASQMMKSSTAAEMIQKAFRGKGVYTPAPPPTQARITNPARLLGKAPIQLGSQMEPIGVASQIDPNAIIDPRNLTRAQRLNLLLAEKAGLSRPIQMGSAMEPIGSPSTPQSQLPYRPSLQHPPAFVRPGEIRPPANMELLPPHQGGIFSIDVPAGSSVTGPDINAIRSTGEASRRSSAQWIQDVIRRQGLPVDPMLKDVQAQLQQRAAAFQAQREALGPLGLQSQQTFNPSPNPSDIPPATPYYERYGQVAGPQAQANTAAALPEHEVALRMAKARLGPGASISDILKLAGQLQNPK